MGSSDDFLARGVAFNDKDHRGFDCGPKIVPREARKHRARERNEDALNDKETFEVVQEEDVNRGYYGLLWERSDAP